MIYSKLNHYFTMLCPKKKFLQYDLFYLRSPVIIKMKDVTVCKGKYDKILIGDITDGQYKDVVDLAKGMHNGVSGKGKLVLPCKRMWVAMDNEGYVLDSTGRVKELPNHVVNGHVAIM